MCRLLAILTLAFVVTPAGARAQPRVDLVVRAGRSLRAALDTRVLVRHPGQQISATIVEPVYAYDRVVVPVGTAVRGHIAKIEPAPGKSRIRAMLAGDFSPMSRIVIQLDRLVLADGQEIPIETLVTGAVENITVDVAASPDKSGTIDRARQDAARRIHETIGTIAGPGKRDRLEDALIRRLPYHPQLLSKGTVLNAELASPIDFGPVTVAASAPAGAVPAPDSVLDARLVTAVDSGKATRGAPIRAIVVQPVFSADHELILPEGAELAGEVTLARGARRFHRNGQLRFLFETVTVPERAPAPLLASLYSVQAGAADHVAVDDEGGTTIANSKSRFIAPALSLVALRGTLRRHHFEDHDGDANDVAGGVTRQGTPGARAFGGFFGLGLLGIGVAQLSHPLGIALAVVGTARTTYAAVFAKGREVAFPVDTPIQVQLAPVPASETPHR